MMPAARIDSRAMASGGCPSWEFVVEPAAEVKLDGEPDGKRAVTRCELSDDLPLGDVVGRDCGFPFLPDPDVGCGLGEAEGTWLGEGVAKSVGVG